jgi:hypothetical protein
VISDDRAVSTEIHLYEASGSDDGYRRDLPLERKVPQPIRVDATRLGPSHPMFLVRLRMFLDWHRHAGHQVDFTPPRDGAVRTALENVRRLTTPIDVDDLALDATEMLSHQARELAIWGDAMYMAIGELCDNARQHGVNDLGTYVATGRIDAPRPEFRLAIADLGIGIPEHIRAQHPEWHNDTAAIVRALERGVTGTGDRHRGNGFSEVFDSALENQLIRSLSAATLDIRSGKGRVSVELVGGMRNANGASVERPRRGTWITYSVSTIEAP